eukprot:gene13161-biopygen5261
MVRRPGASSSLKVAFLGEGNWNLQREQEQQAPHRADEGKTMASDPEIPGASLTSMQSNVRPKRRAAGVLHKQTHRHRTRMRLQSSARLRLCSSPCGFLAAAELAPEPEASVSAWLARQIEAFSDRVTARKGVVDLVSSDRFFASFGAVRPCGVHQEAAVACAAGRCRHFAAQLLCSGRVAPGVAAE